MLVALEGVGRAEHHEDRRTCTTASRARRWRCAERVADHRVAGADDAGRQHQPVADVADLFVEQVDPGAQRQQRTHHVLARSPLAHAFRVRVAWFLQSNRFAAAH